MKKVNEEIKEVSVLDSMLEDVKSNEKVSKKMSEEDLLKFVYENFNNEDMKSKNGMLKFLSGSGLSCSMDSVFKMYNLVEKEVKKEVKKEESE